MSLITNERDRYISDFLWAEMNNWGDTPVYHRSTGRLVTVYLISSFLYYHLNDSVLSDSDYDAICKELLNRTSDPFWHHHLWHANLIDPAALRAGTAFSIKAEAYPVLLKTIALDFYRRLCDDNENDARLA